MSKAVGGRSSTKELIDRAVFSAKNRKCFYPFSERPAFGLLSSCSVPLPCSQTRRALRRRYRNVAFGVSPTRRRHSILSALFMRLVGTIIHSQVHMSWHRKMRNGCSSNLIQTAGPNSKKNLPRPESIHPGKISARGLTPSFWPGCDRMFPLSRWSIIG